MNRAAVIKLAILSTLIMFSGCANLSMNDVYRNPSFHYQKTSISSVSFSEINAVSTIKIANSNPYNLPLSSLKAELWLEGKQWITLSNNAVKGIPALGNIDVDFDWSFVFSKLLTQAKSVYDQGEAEFTLKLEPTFNVPLLGPQTLSWSSKIKLPVPKAPKLAVTNWSLESFSLSKLVIALDIEINNPNVFSVQASNWGMLLTSQTNPALAKIGLNRLDIVASGKSNQKVELTLSLADIGLSLFNGLRQQRWPEGYGLKWSGDWSSKDIDFKLPSIAGSTALRN